MSEIDANVSEDMQITESGIVQQHENERKELKAKIAALKRGVAKGDKKQKRETAAEIARLQEELQNRHDAELLNTTSPPSGRQLVSTSHLEDALKGVTIDGNKSGVKPPIRISKAQRWRDKKECQNRIREELVREEAEQNLSGARHLEAEKLKSILASRTLQIHEIPSDGDCLYGAICHQLSLHGIMMTVKELRRQTARFIRQNQDDFMPFLCDPDTGSIFTNDKFEEYCVDIETKPAWGGQLELRAISQVLKRPIEVIQAEGQHLLLGDDFTEEPFTITYHRHAFGLGEHFNSVSPAATTAAPEVDKFS